MAKSSRASSSSSSMEFLLIEDLDFVQVEEQGLSHWEFVNASDADSERGEQGDEIDEDKEDCIGNGIGSLDSDISTPICLKNSQMENRDVDHQNPHHHDVDAGVKYEAGYCGFARGYDDGGRGEEQFDNEGDEDDDANDGYDLNDELVPWNVSDKFGRQRMRKLGKRAFPKMHNSKRSPYLFVRPGCVRGKHGLGLKHSF
ncbi:uncharacterized protein LOC108986937 [Juglans regia]|uniref:Uncharacterized protein LOC108986937 n=2 Tax=Juglans regia TaxID=51240 RepID=A0A2I4E7D2_JUGRE|nr:uncharacterized protein LOC108986937 [Juglans regia]